MIKREEKSRYRKGLFKPRNPKKYLGNPEQIIYRSSWELKYMLRLDDDPTVVEWASEEFHIPYYSPVDKRTHRYFPDFLVKKKNDKGLIETFVIEIKPLAQTKKPKNTKNRKKMISEATTYAINQCKWAAAREFCARNDFQFQVLTEKELKIK